MSCSQRDALLPGPQKLLQQLDNFHFWPQELNVLRNPRVICHLFLNYEGSRSQRCVKPQSHSLFVLFYHAIILMRVCNTNEQTNQIHCDLLLKSGKVTYNKFGKHFVGRYKNSRNTLTLLWTSSSGPLRWACETSFPSSHLDFPMLFTVCPDFFRENAQDIAQNARKNAPA